MRTTALVVGAGHAGLAMSRRLTEHSIDHVVLERGEVANSWRTERWDSLRLLTPNWQSRLPGYSYDGRDPDGYRDVGETVDFMVEYAEAIAAPVQTRTAVLSLERGGPGYRVRTEHGPREAECVVLASGACNLAAVPELASYLPGLLCSITALEYRRPGDLPEGGVLVVGASASGMQIADEIHRSGRPVTLSVGEHVRVPRVYRGRDIKWWMDVVGVLDEFYTEYDNLQRVRSLPSLQLIGTPERRTLDLNALTDAGVRLVGRLAGISGQRLQFSGSLPNLCALADLKLNRLLERIDAWVQENDPRGRFEPSHRFEPTRVEAAPPLELDLGRGQIRSVVWATGYRPDYSWLEVPVLDRKGRLKHDGGVTPAPGLYVMGLPFLRRRKSSLIDGAADDARDLAEHMYDYLGACRRSGGGPSGSATRRAMA